MEMEIIQEVRVDFTRFSVNFFLNFSKNFE